MSRLPGPLEPVPGVALHRQLFLALRDTIVQGDYAAGEALPSESALCGHFGVSRITVRRALAELEQEGLIERRAGRGSFVRIGVARSFPPATLGYVASLRQALDSTPPRTLRVERAPAPPDVRAHLRAGGDPRLVHAVRLLQQGSVAVALTETWLAPALGEQITLAEMRRSLIHELLLARGVRLGRVVQQFTAQTASAAQARLLGTTTGAALLVASRLVHDRAGVPLHYQRAHVAGERSRVVMDIPAASVDTLASGQLLHDMAAQAG